MPNLLMLSLLAPVAWSGLAANSLALAPPDGWGAPFPVQEFIFSDGVRTLISEDFDADGLPDLVTTGTSDVVLRLGLGDGSFGPAQTWTLLGGLGEVEAVHLDGDPWLDLVVMEQVGPAIAQMSGVRVLWGAPGGTFSIGPHTDLGFSGGALEVGDIDLDGELDLAISHRRPEEREVTVFHGVGDGTFGLGVDWDMAFGPIDLALADLNDDGLLDLTVVTAPYTFQGKIPKLVTSLNVGSGQFAPAVKLVLPESASSIVLHDLDGDRIPDALVGLPARFSTGWGGGIGVYPGLGDGTFGSGSVTPLPGAATGLQVADIDGDAEVELVVTQSGTFLTGRSLAWFPLPGGGGLGPVRAVPLGVIGDAAVVDLDLDGHPELVGVRGGAIGSVTVVRGLGAGRFELATELQVLTADLWGSTLDAGDVNGDGWIDLLAVDDSTQTLSVLPATGPGTWGAPVTYALGFPPIALELAHLDDDDLLDVALAGWGGQRGVLSVLHGQPGGGFAFGPAGAVQEVGRWPTRISAGDVLEDGRADLLVSNLLASVQTVSFDVGLPQLLGPQPVALGGAGGPGLGLADLNGDQHLDVFGVTGALGGAGEVVLRAGDGLGGFGPPATYPVAAFPLDIVAGDLNGDGLDDLIVIHLGEQKLSILLGREDGTLAPASTHLAVVDPVSLACADINGDGYLDVLVSGRQERQLAVLLGDGLGGLGPPSRFHLGLSPLTLIAADLDGDGDVDAAVATPGDGALTVLFHR